MPHPIEACYNSRLHCVAHDEDEPGEGYRWCMECFHMYATEQELLDAHNAMMAEMTGPIPRDGGWGSWMTRPTLSPSPQPETDPAKVHSCPYCAHSF